MAEVPDLLRLSKVPSNLQQNVETDLIETSTFQEATATGTGFARFDLQQKGFLHSHSKIFLSLIPKAGQAGFAHLPPNIGIGSLVQRAVLKCGNQTLNEIEDWSHLHMIKSAQGDNENNVEREYYTTGRVMNFDFIYPRSEVAGGAIAPTRQKHLSTIMGLQNGRDKLDIGGGNYSVDPMPFAQLQANHPTQSPTYAIDMSDLFPFLKTHSLPLYMIQQQMSVELHFSRTVDKRVQLSAAKSADGDYLIDTSELKLCADYVYYTEGDVMARYAEANRNLEFSFPDYRLSKSSVDSADFAGGGIVRNLGMANRLCSRVVTVVCDDGENDQTILGPYNSCCPERVAAGTTGAVKYNVRYNDRFEFPQALENKAQIFTHFQKSEGVLFLPTEVYADTYVGLPGATQLYARRQQSRTAGTPGLAGAQWMLATRLTTGRVGVKGIELHLTQDGMNALAGGRNYTMRSYCEYARLARLEDGFLAVYNA